ncbi:MAG: 2-oxo-4-hydroxy-4-carboxy-5-ureidoimidazoline decarboxylase [Chloroflexota bacterium]|nr:2-oxo-4-hydroxy-4-carboxy-5-ureidoimidazoline decarboxylase [Chloroflexota bacterium]
MEEQPLPTAAELDRVATADFMRLVAPLFEDAPGLAARLAPQRPFGTDDRLLDAIRRAARQMPEEDQLRLLNAHPRIGADREAMSALSRSEQGEADGAGGATGSLAEKLEMLNAAYEQRFGFRFVIFVGGRSRSEMVPLLENALRRSRREELRRGLDDVVRIAGDRLRRLRRAPEAPAR